MAKIKVKKKEDMQEKKFVGAMQKQWKSRPDVIEKYGKVEVKKTVKKP